MLGELDGRTSERVQRLAKLLDVVSPTRVSDNILGYTWAKHVYGALLVATALVDAHVHEVVERSAEIQRMLVALTIENMNVAERAGIRLLSFDEYDPADYRAAVQGDAAARARAMASIADHYRAAVKTKTGIWRDLAVRKRKTEVGALLGATVARARSFGLAMPLTERLIAHDRGAGDRPAPDVVGQSRRAGQAVPAAPVAPRHPGRRPLESRWLAGCS